MENNIEILLGYDKQLAALLPILRAQGYVREKIALENLEMSSPPTRMIELPRVKVTWSNRAVNRELVFRIYLGELINCIIVNTENRQDFVFRDYMRQKSKEAGQQIDLAEYLENNSFERFAALFTSEVEGDLGSVIAGQKWIKVEFDWNGMK